MARKQSARDRIPPKWHFHRLFVIILWAEKHQPVSKTRKNLWRTPISEEKPLMNGSEKTPRAIYRVERNQQWPHLVNVWQGWNPRIFYRLVKGRVGGENPRRKPPGSPTENIFGTPSTSEIPTPPPRRNPCSKLLDYTARPRAEQNSTSVQSSKRPQAEEVLLFGATITLITWWFSNITSNGVGSPPKKFTNP